MKKPVGYICEPCEFITLELIHRIEEAHKKFKSVGIGIHSDDFFVELNGRNPIKSYEIKKCTDLAMEPVDVIFFGSDLRNVDVHNDTKIPILFTERDPILMKQRSSSYYRQILEELKSK